MVDKICEILTNKIRREMPEIDDERAEIINYGLQNIVGEIPKTFIIFGIAYFLGIFKLTLLVFILLLPYRAFSGGLHLHTHIGCIIGTTAFYCGIALLSKYLILDTIFKYILTALIWTFSIIMIKLYAPADTENLPILRKNERKRKQILSYVTVCIYAIVAICTSNVILSNILIFGTLVQSIMITRFAYKITNNKYGYEIYANQNN